MQNSPNNPTPRLDLETDHQLPDSHRAVLTRSIGRIAEHSLVDIAEAEAELGQLTKLEKQTELMGNYFAAASQELGSQASEDEIWDRVYDQQLADWSKTGNPDVAVNMLVGNILATSGMDETKAQEVTRDRLWRVAQSGRGKAFVDTARLNSNVFVYGVGPDESSKTLLAEQVDPYNALLAATDHSTIKSTLTGLPIHCLQTATTQQQVWFINEMADNLGYDVVKANLVNIPDITAVARTMGRNKEVSGYHLEQLGLLADSKTNRAFIEGLIEAGHPTYFADLDTMDAEDQVAIFDILLQRNSDQLDSALSQEAGFNNLPLECLDILIEEGFFQRHPSANIRAFRKLPPAYLDKLQSEGVSNFGIIRSLKIFDERDARKFTQTLIDNGEFSDIASNPEDFYFMTKEEIVDLARETNNFRHIANYINQFTDGSNQLLLDEIVENFGIDILATAADYLDNLDKEWFGKEMLKHGSLGAIVLCMRSIPGLDQGDLLERIMNDPKHRDNLKFHLRYFKQVEPQELYDRLAAAGCYVAIVENAQMFEHKTQLQIYDQFKDIPEALKSFADNRHKFHEVDIMDLYARLQSTQQLTSIAKLFNRIKAEGVDETELFEQIKYSTDALRELCYNIDSDGADSELMAKAIDSLFLRGDYAVAQLFVNGGSPIETQWRLVKEAIFYRDLPVLESSIAKLKLDRLDMLQACIQGGMELVYANDKRPLIPKKYMPSAEELIEMGATSLLLAHPDKYPGIDTQALYSRMTHTHSAEMIDSFLLSFQPRDVPYNIANYLVVEGKAESVRINRRAFDKRIFTPEFFELYLIGKDEGFLDLYRYAGLKIDRIDKAVEIFGADLNTTVLDCYQTITNPHADLYEDELRSLGVVASDREGVAQLQGVIRTIRQSMHRGLDDETQYKEFLKLIVENPVAKAIAQSLVRYQNAEWGDHDDSGWQKIISDLAQTDPRNNQLPEGFTPSEIYMIGNLKSTEAGENDIDEDAKKRYELFATSIGEALQLANSSSKGRYQGLFQQANDILDLELEKLEALREKFVNQGKEKALIGVDMKISRIRDVRSKSTADFMRSLKNNFGQIADLNIKELEPIVRTAIFTRAITKNSVARRLAHDIHSAGEPNYERMLEMQNFIEHIINQEVYGKYFDSKEALKDFKRVNDTTAFSLQTDKRQQSDIIGTSGLQFVPSRGLMLELSGHVSDACWASRGGSISAGHKNVTAITYVRNPGQPTERLVGAGLLIDTVDQTTGEPVLVVRGTNPIQNYINSVKVEDFVDGLLDYVGKIAGNRKIAIVLDTAPGHATTNRPVLHEYLTRKRFAKLRKNGEPVKLPADTTFNGYELSKEGYPAYIIPTEVAAANLESQ